MALKSGAVANAASAARATASVKAPWDGAKQTPASQLVTDALSGRPFFDAKTFSTTGGSADDKKLFALHTGLTKLAALASRFDQKGVSTVEQQRLSAAFDSGMRQLESFLSTTKFDAFTMTQAAKLSAALSQAAIGETRRTYTTGVIAVGSPDAANATFSEPMQFSINVVDLHDNAQTLNIDLADMGATPRSLNNVIDYLNSKLRAAGMTSAFSAVKGAPVKGQDAWSLKLSIAIGEKIAFDAPTAGAALYLAGGDGVTKIADPASGIATSTLAPANVAYSKAMADAASIGAVRASAVGSDGALYVLVDAVGAIDGQPIKGSSDMALIKYDSAGNQVFTRTLGAAGEAHGYSLAIGPDGQIAVAGSVVGALGDNATAAKSGLDSFLAVYNEAGVEQFVQRSTGAAAEEARAVAFGADGQVYVASRAKDEAGLWQATLATYSPAGTRLTSQSLGKVDAVSNQALVVEDLGSGATRVTVGAMEGGRLVLRQFEASGADLNASATRELGALAGGALVGLALDNGAIYVAGDARAPLDFDTVATSFNGGQDGFVAKLSSDLTASPSDWISYIGGPGDEHIAGLAVSDGTIWLGGDSTAAFAQRDSLKELDGFVARLGSDGALAWSQRVASPDGRFNTTSFAVDLTGVSALDRLGLPRGAPAQADALDLISRTALRPGDQFSISINGRPAQVVTIQASDTLQTLADRLKKILLSAGDASVSLSMTDGDKLQIKAAAGARIELHSGPFGKDALAGLGLSESVITADSISKKAKATPAYGLGISSALSLADKASRKLVTDQIGVALSVIQSAYRELTAPAAKTASAGDAPAYLTKQLANYQAALARLQDI